MQGKDRVSQLSAIVSQTDKPCKKAGKNLLSDLELTLIYPARLLESNLQGNDLNPIVLLFPF